MCITIKDVAKAANVSPSTVSRVLGNNPRISDETKKRVLDTIEKLGYHPNAIARGLANNSSRIIGLIIPNEAENLFKNPFYIQVMTGISVYTRKKGYYIMYAFSRNEDEEVGFIKSYTNSKLVDGIILLTSRQNDKCINYISERNFPFVVVGRPENTKNILWVDNDNLETMYNVVSSLIAKGHDDIAFIGGPADWNMSKDRLDGYKKALDTHGFDYDERLIKQMSDFSEQCGREAMEDILTYKIPSAVVTTDDLIAFGAMRVLKEIGKTKVSVVGFNNTPLAEYQTPSLSSVNINAEKLGYYAAKLLIDKLEKDKISTTHYIVETNLVERNSTK